MSVVGMHSGVQGGGDGAMGSTCVHIGSQGELPADLTISSASWRIFCGVLLSESSEMRLQTGLCSVPR